MTAKGKINSSKVQAGDRIIVKVSETGTVSESSTKTGEGVQVARVVGKQYLANHSGFRQPGRYVIETTAGTFYAAPIQTMWLAPEDAAGIKRSHVEALVEQGDRWKAGMDEVLEEALAEDAERAAAGETLLEAEQRHLDEVAQAPLTLHSQDGKVSDMDNDTATQIVTGDMTGSAVVELMETVWDRIRENHPELPAVVIVTGSGLLGGSKWGHFRRDGWKIQAAGEGAAISGHMDEMFMAGETLAKGARQVLQTMLHEGAHTLAKVRGVQDTSRQGRWHNAKFKELAAEMGLEHKNAQADKSIGFSFVSLTEATIERYADLLTELDAAIRLVCHLPAWLGGTGDEDEKGGENIGKAPRKTEPSTSTNIKLTCACDEPVIIRASRKVADLMQVRCDECESLFTGRS